MHSPTAIKDTILEKDQVGYNKNPRQFLILETLQSSESKDQGFGELWKYEQAIETILSSDQRY
jgi:hypothetical protein